ncbi:MAG: hypothetical protein LBH31_05825, partial [Burkholderiaceae bacterium]|nr:hypothetical protein [Burkholderiaceae bacterium]
MSASRLATVRPHTQSNLKFRRSALSLAALSTALLAAPAFAQSVPATPTPVWHDQFSQAISSSTPVISVIGYTEPDGITFNTTDAAWMPTANA